MSGSFKEIDVKELRDNPFKLIGEDWMLITAGTPESHNTMTASWGGLGFMWNKNIATCLVRPSRHTYSFMEDSDRFTLSFFTEDYREVLNFCGTHSGKDTDKPEETGITAAGEGDSVWFDEARLVMVCRKLYTDTLKPERFLSPDIEEFYKGRDYHTFYYGEIERCLLKG